MQISRKQPEFQKPVAALVSSLHPCDDVISSSRRVGIVWDASPLVTPAVCRASSLPSRVVKSTSSACDWDPLLKLRVRDAVVSDGRRTRSFSRNEFSLPLVPVAVQGSGAVTLKDDVVRVWDSESKTLLKSVHLSERCGGAVTAFDVNWESKVAAMARKGGLVSIANLEIAAYEECYQTPLPVVQAVHLDRTSSSKTLFTGWFSAIAFCTL